MLASGFGVGYSPAGGTLGSVWGLLLFTCLHSLPPLTYVLTLVTFFFVAVFISSQAERIFGEKDSGKIVIDEMVGMMIAVSFLPFSFQNLILGFIFFRVLDIFKPFPIRVLEKKLAGGLGVVMDDVAAGLVANLLLRAITHWL